MPGSIMTQLFAGRLVHPELQDVLQNLSEMFGPNLHFISHDGKYINFQVWGMTDEVLFRELEANQDDIFDDISVFQVLRPWGHSPDRGVFLQHLETPHLRSEYLSGFWYY